MFVPSVVSEPPPLMLAGELVLVDHVLPVTSYRLNVFVPFPKVANTYFVPPTFRKTRPAPVLALAPPPGPAFGVHELPDALYAQKFEPEIAYTVPAPSFVSAPPAATVAGAAVSAAQELWVRSYFWNVVVPLPRRP